MISRYLDLVILSAVLAAPALAHEYKLGSLEIGQPWTRATPATAQAGAGFLAITNTGTTPDRLVAASCPEAAEKTQIHEIKMESNIMSMREVERGLDIPPGVTVNLAPGGFHIMLMGLKAPLRQGTTVPCKLTFEKVGSIDIELAVESLGATRPSH